MNTQLDTHPNNYLPDELPEQVFVWVNQGEVVLGSPARFADHVSVGEDYGLHVGPLYVLRATDDQHVELVLLRKSREVPRRELLQDNAQVLDLSQLRHKVHLTRIGQGAYTYEEGRHTFDVLMQATTQWLVTHTGPRPDLMLLAEQDEEVDVYEDRTTYDHIFSALKECRQHIAAFVTEMQQFGVLNDRIANRYEASQGRSQKARVTNRDLFVAVN